MPRYKLRTLLILLAIGPPMLAPLMVWGWREYVAWYNTRMDALVPGTGYLGGEFDDPPGVGGVQVNAVRRGFAAEAGGLMAGDVITAINNRPCNGVMDLDVALDQATVGTTLIMVVSRSGSQKTLRVTLGRRPTQPGSPPPSNPEMPPPS